MTGDMRTPQNQLKIWCFATLSILFAIFCGWLLYHFWNLTPLKRKEASFSPGQIVQGKFNSSHRKFIQISDDGYYIVQDFHSTGKPATNPYRVKDRDDLFRDYSEQQSIEGLYAHTDSNGGMNYFNYRSGLKDGSAFAIYNDGNIESRENYRQGRLDGEFIRFFRDGQKKFERIISSDKKDIRVIMWWYTGEKKTELLIRNDEPIEDRAWYVNGAKRREGYMKDGRGHWTTWHKNGQVSSEMYTVDSVPVKCSEYGKDGKVLHKDETSSTICKEIFDKKYYREGMESQYDPYTDD